MERARASGRPSTYITTASPTPVAIRPKTYMAGYAPSMAMLVNGMV